MFWEELSLDQVGTWIAATMVDERPPPLWVYPSVPEQIAMAERLVAEHGLQGEVSPLSGTVRVWGQDLLERAVDYVYATEMHREPDYATSLSEEERPPAHVVQQVLTKIGGVRSVGPGGRIIVYEQGFADISVRPGGEVGPSGYWRLPSNVLGPVEAMAGGVTGGRLRGAFGYVEPSSYEAAYVLRPTFVFVLDGPVTADGPNWRLALEVAASEGRGDESPHWVGNFDDGCV